MNPGRLAGAALALVLSCAPQPPPVVTPAPARLRGLDFSVTLDASGEPATRLGGEVRVVNRGSEPESLVFPDDCPVRLRIYDIDGDRVAPVWDGPAGCERTPVVFAIAPGESARLPIPITEAREILGNDLGEGPYRVTVWLAPEERVIEIEAGNVELAAR